MRRHRRADRRAFRLLLLELDTMKSYEVALKYESYATIRVDAENEAEAERLAWEELASDGSYQNAYGDWTLEGIVEEVKP